MVRVDQPRLSDTFEVLLESLWQGESKRPRLTSCGVVSEGTNRKNKKQTQQIKTCNNTLESPPFERGCRASGRRHRPPPRARRCFARGADKMSLSSSATPSRRSASSKGTRTRRPPAPAPLRRTDLWRLPCQAGWIGGWRPRAPRCGRRQRRPRRQRRRRSRLRRPHCVRLLAAEMAVVPEIYPGQLPPQAPENPHQQ